METTGGKKGHLVKDLKITVLSTMLSGNPMYKGVGEWGFSALVEVDGQRILFDAGEHEDVVWRNLQEMGMDISDVTDLIITHNHWDHVGGLNTLRRELSKKNPDAVSRAHVGKGIFISRNDSGHENNGLLPLRPEYERMGGAFIEHAGPTELWPGVWFTGPVPRQYPERNWTGTGTIKTEEGVVEDNVIEDSSLIFDTVDGLVVLTGCGHAGVVNTIEYARKTVRHAPVYALIGGIHLFPASDETVEWTGNKLREFQVSHFLAAHCTGIEATYRLREMLGLDRKTAVVSAVGSSFSLDKGIDPLLLAR